MCFRDGPDACTFVGIDVSGDFLEQAKANLLSACPKMRKDRVELIQATYMDGVKEARNRCGFNDLAAALPVIHLGVCLG